MLHRNVLISFIISTALLAALFMSWHGIDIEKLWNSITWPLLRLIIIMGISLGLSALVEGMGWNSMVAALSRPLMRAGNFSDFSGTAFTSAFLSGVAANTLLWNAYKEQKISRREMLLATLLNLGLPSYSLHLPVTFAIIVPLAGRAGAVYITITLLAAILRTIIVLLLGRILLSRHNTPANVQTGRKTGEPVTMDARRAKVKKLLKKYLKVRLGNILCYTVPIYLFVAFLQQSGFFHWLQEAGANLFIGKDLPVEGISVVVFSIAAEFTAGAAAAGAMLNAGVLTLKETVTALIIGNIIATPIRALRHQLPRYLGIYQLRTGLELLVMGQTLRIISVIIIGWSYYVLA